jgi:hypothetical protein
VSSLQSIFWNSAEKRIRMFWRITGQLLIMLPLLFILQILLVGVGLGLVASQGGVSPEQMTDPAAVNRLISDSPLLMMLALGAMGISVFVSVFIAGRLLDRRRFADFGLHFNRRWWADFAFGAGLGAVLMLFIFLIELALGWVTVSGTLVTRQPEASFLPALLIPLLTFLAVGIYEELFSRGYQLTNLAEGLSGTPLGKRGAIAAATVISSAVFGLLHATNPNATAFSTFNIAVAGIFLAAGFILTGELSMPIGLHITWNFFQGNVFGFPVSGGNYRSATFIAVQQGGPDLWTGGAFGPEAGLLGLGAMLLGIVLTILWVKHSYGEVSLHLDITDPPQRSTSSQENPPD